MPPIPKSHSSRKVQAPEAELHAPIEIVAIGGSTGGPNALAELLPQFSNDFPVPIVIVQHMPPIFTKCLGERLSAQSHIHVQEGRSGDLVQAGYAWIAPGDNHMVLKRQGTHVVVLAMNQDPPENSCRPAVDVLFRSVSQTYGAGVLAVVLTGMGHDGRRGAQVIREAGGQVIAQDEASSVVWGMPGAVVRAGLAQRELPLSQIAHEITRKVGAGHALVTASPQ